MKNEETNTQQSSTIDINTAEIFKMRQVCMCVCVSTLPVQDLLRGTSQEAPSRRIFQRCVQCEIHWHEFTSFFCTEQVQTED